MIKNVFLPDQVGNYYLFVKRIAGIYIGKIGVHVTVIRAQGTTRTVERSFEIPFDTAPTTDNADRTITALQDAVQQLGVVHEIHTAITSSVVVFKELRLPFSSYEKISLIVPFEVEPLLPFSLADAVVDFIITHVDTQTQHAHVLVAAVQKKHISQHLELFAQAGINPDRISIDLIDVYSLYKQIPILSQPAQTTALIHIGLQETMIAYLDAGQLRFVRTLQKGMVTIAKYVGDKLHITPAQAMEHIMRFGSQETDWPEYATAFKEGLTALLDSIQFTMSSFAAQSQSQTILQSLLFIGVSELPKGMVSFCQDFFKLSIISFETTHLTALTQTKLPDQLPQSAGSLISSALALPTLISEFFNLRKQEFEIVSTSLIYKQLATIVTLSLCILLSLIGYSYTQLNILHQEVAESEQEATDLLSDRFKQLEHEGGSLDELIESARQVLQRDKKTWAAFSAEYRASYLRYLLELTTRLDKEALGLTLDKITFTDNVMILKGQVKDFDAIKLLRQELQQSKLFVHVERENNPQFDALKITLSHAGLKGP